MEYVAEDDTELSALLFLRNSRHHIPTSRGAGDWTQSTATVTQALDRAPDHQVSVKVRRALRDHASQQRAQGCKPDLPGFTAQLLLVRPHTAYFLLSSTVSNTEKKWVEWHGLPYTAQ